MSKLESLLASMNMSPEAENFIRSYVEDNPESAQLVQDMIQLDQGITEMDLVKALKNSTNS